MAASNPSQLFLLADHIKLSLLERQRAISLNLAPNTQDAQISRSLDQLQSGIAALESQASGWDDPLNPTSEQQEFSEQVKRLKSQYSDLSLQFRGSQPNDPSTLTSPNDPALSADFSAASSRKPSKSVRFTDNPSASAAGPTQNKYAPYRDDPSDEEPPDHSQLSNQQIHEYHQEVLREQDEQLDRLGESIGRQRDLSIQIGNELDDHAMLLDEVDERVDRHQGQLDRANKGLNTFARKAKENWSLTVIILLIIILVLLIIITK
ncbi:uncharacterized protein PV09_02350 [Verruconis gallopava]|uniref:t-SNARE coiled-coil homology domain-containing protein n=1 Tax=Verruconis gallopava TaxID=253628 RepID=A0A0D2AID8_9PEZI|nr:uncharacterized protein PV09_02350 [Verruconis gallopava]KIW06638.1 hypothetical protein PV09_02350 [Verruconis gallopava]